jgi:two-component system OmpR family sensor kinase
VLSRLPLRLRLTIAFAGVMALVLIAAAVFLRITLARELDAGIDQTLRTRAAAVAALVETGDGRLGEDVGGEPEESFAQVLGTGGEVRDATEAAGDRPLLDASQIRSTAGGTVIVESRDVADDDDRVRLLAQRVQTDAGPRVVVAGASLDDRDEALATLTWLLLIGAPVALLIASLAGYGLAAAALRPVEAMRARAALISGGEADARLPVPPARDEVRRLAETLNEMIARIESSRAREREFLADAAHELRTPLAILKVELELALAGEATAGDLRAAVTSAGEEVDRLAQLAEDLLVLARADRGRLPIRPAAFDAAAALEGVRERFARRAEQRERRIVAHAPPRLELVADRARVEQALGNLVDNALRHGDGTIMLEATEEGDRVVLSVADEGPGFPPAFLADAFERFTRADTARTGAGSGLGLAIVRTIAEAHSGTATVANRPSGGAVACLMLPRAAPVP